MGKHLRPCLPHTRHIRQIAKHTGTIPWSRNPSSYIYDTSYTIIKFHSDKDPRNVHPRVPKTVPEGITNEAKCRLHVFNVPPAAVGRGRSVRV